MIAPAFARGTRVRVKSNDPTEYMRIGASATPSTQTVGSVQGTALRQFGKRQILIVSVLWDNETSGVYWSTALNVVE